MRGREPEDEGGPSETEKAKEETPSGASRKDAPAHPVILAQDDPFQTYDLGTVRK